MNCTSCNKPLEPNARFCRNCGTPVATVATNNASANPAPPYRTMDTHEPPTLPPGPLRIPQAQQQPPQQAWQPQSAPQPQPAPQQTWQPQSAPQPAYYQPGRPEPGSLSNAQNGRPRRRRRGCLTRSLITLVVLLILIVGGWFLGLQPYLSNMAQSGMDGVLTDAVNHIPPEISVLRAGPVQLSEQVLNNLLVLGSAPNDLVKNPQIHITSSAMRMDFQVYGFSCAVSGVPQVNQGHLVATNVTIEGIAGLILTPDQITTLVNKHLAAAQTKINHPIESVQLKDQELDLTLGQPGSGGLPPLP
jgi:hypothetical protein